MARLLLAKVYGDITVDVPRDSHRFEWRAAAVDLGPVTIFSGAITSSVIMRGEPSGYTVRLAAGSPERAASSGEATEIVAGRSAAVFSPGARSELSAEGLSLPITVRIDARYLEAQLEALTGVPIRRPVAFALSMPTADGAGSFLERLCHFLAEAERAGPALGHALLTASLGEAVTRALLLGQPHDHTHLLERPAPPSSKSVVRLVEGYIDAHAAGPVRTTDLTALVGASMASINAAFRAHRATTPMAFLRERRLLLARERLRSPDRGETVTDVAHAAGFLRREKFDAVYAAEHGESPVETKRRGLLATEPPPPSPRRAMSIPSPEKATVFVVHGDPSRCEALAGVLREAGHEVRAFASSRALRAAARPSGAGCAVLDAELARSEGLEAATALRASGCALPVVLTSDDGDVRMAVEAMKAGAVDFLLEPIEGATLLAAVERGLARDAEARAARAGEEALAARVAVLSPREREVCDRVARGMLNKQIAAELGISASAVRIYRAKGMEKLGVGSAAELASLFTRRTGGR
jgi:FixJ family two-component response regulator/AraC-like DNA-binding protein